ncbi:MAG: hypothetical protein ACREIS_13425, partial [Nitrospiraceae bacterium]
GDQERTQGISRLPVCENGFPHQGLPRALLSCRNHDERSNKQRESATAVGRPEHIRRWQVGVLLGGLDAGLDGGKA